jgi:hypothetical protein
MTAVGEAVELVRTKWIFLRQRNGHDANVPTWWGWMQHGRRPNSKGALEVAWGLESAAGPVRRPWPLASPTVDGPNSTDWADGTVASRCPIPPPRVRVAKTERPMLRARLTMQPHFAHERVDARLAARTDPHGRLPVNLRVVPGNHYRGYGIARDLARTRDRMPTEPREYVRKGVRYLAWVEDGVIWVVQQVADAPG